MPQRIGSGSNTRLVYTGDEKVFVPIDNYLYFHHLGKYFILPVYPSSIQDNMSANFPRTDILGRSAPIFTYSNSGPRTVQFSLKLHRDMLRQVNLENSTIKSDDYVDTLIKLIQASVVPEYNDPAKMINPPVVTCRIADEIYIKGVLTQGGQIKYSTPLLETYGHKKKYAIAETNFQISEFDPYTASEIAEVGSYRLKGADLGGRKLYGYDGLAQGFDLNHSNIGTPLSQNTGSTYMNLRTCRECEFMK